MPVNPEIIQRVYTQAHKVVSQLEIASNAYLAEPTNELYRDAVIQRFELSYELLWKLFRHIHVARGVAKETVRAAYECIAEAGAAGWLKDRSLWEHMRDDRNVTSHEYNCDAVDRVAKQAGEHYFPEMKRVLAFLKQNYIDRTPYDSWSDRA